MKFHDTIREDAASLTAWRDLFLHGVHELGDGRLPVVMRPAPIDMFIETVRCISEFSPTGVSRALRASTTLAITLLIVGCGVLGGSDLPSAKEPAKLEISIKADAEVNQNVSGRGAPVLLRVYELKSEIAFKDADFFALQNTDKAVLGADLLTVDQFIVRPGETRQITRKSNPETAFIGIFAGYRDLPNSTWRVVHQLLPAHDKSWYRVVIPANKVRLLVELQSNAIQMTDEDAETQSTPYANESLKGLDAIKSEEPEGLAKRAEELVKSPAQLPNIKEFVKPFKLP